MSKRRHVAEGCWEAAVVDSANLSVDRRIFQGLGGFGLDFPGAALMEDCVFGWRAQRKGVKLIKNYNVRVESHESNISLRQVCSREERVAAAYLTLARIMPEQFAAITYLAENGPVRSSDAAALKLRSVSGVYCRAQCPSSALFGSLSLGRV